jgi:hypothetical protein
VLIAKYFHVLRSKSYILRDREHLGKFDGKSDEGIFMRYSSSSRAYRVYNKRTGTMMKSIDVVVDDDSSDAPCDAEVPVEEINKDLAESSDTEKLEMLAREPPSRERVNHPKENILGDLDEGKRLRSQVINQVPHMCCHLRLNLRR